jgi:hypothetical protein
VISGLFFFRCLEIESTIWAGLVRRIDFRRTSRAKNLEFHTTVLAFDGLGLNREITAWAEILTASLAAL